MKTLLVGIVITLSTNMSCGKAVVLEKNIDSYKVQYGTDIFEFYNDDIQAQEGDTLFCIMNTQNTLNFEDDEIISINKI